MQKEVEQWCCRWAPSLGALEDTHENVWGTKTYDPETDIDKPCVFFGLYGFPDFIALWRHKGRKAILWAGSDIRHFNDGYWLNDTGDFRIDSKSLANWIGEFCENYVENEVEYKALLEFGIYADIVPSFLGDIDEYKVSYQWSERPKVYTSVSGDNFRLYGWNRIRNLAYQNPKIEFHLYGNETGWLPTYGSDMFLNNVVVHGRISKEQMNEEIKMMHGALRLTEFDGFSEILAKSILWGQWPVSLIEYSHMINLRDLSTLKDKKDPNIEGREFYRKVLNNYPWNVKKHKTT